MLSEAQMKAATWRPANSKYETEAQLALPFTGKHQALGFTEYPMKEEQIAPMNDQMIKTFGSSARKVPTGETRPIEHVYRGMSHEEWAQAQERGHIRSDARGAIAPEWEGTNAGLDEKTARGYRDSNSASGGRGVIAKIAVHPDDKWFLSDVDSYARTRNPVPLSRVQIVDSR